MRKNAFGAAGALHRTAVGAYSAPQSRRWIRGRSEKNEEGNKKEGKKGKERERNGHKGREGKEGKEEGEKGRVKYPRAKILATALNTYKCWLCAGSDGGQKKRNDCLKANSKKCDSEPNELEDLAADRSGWRTVKPIGFSVWK